MLSVVPAFSQTLITLCLLTDCSVFQQILTFSTFFKSRPWKILSPPPLPLFVFKNACITCDLDTRGNPKISSKVHLEKSVFFSTKFRTLTFTLLCFYASLVFSTFFFQYLLSRYCYGRDCGGTNQKILMNTKKTVVWLLKGLKGP